MKSLFSVVALLFAVVMTALVPVSASEIVRGTGMVNYVIDGDTMDIRVPVEVREELVRRGLVDERHVSDRFGTFRVRLAFIDTEESVHEDESRNSEAGDASSEYVKSLILRQPTEFTCFRKGRYGRAVCSLAFNEIGDLGIHLIEQGHSPYVTAFGRHPHLDAEYRQAERDSGQARSRFQQVKEYVSENVDTESLVEQARARWGNN